MFQTTNQNMMIFTNYYNRMELNMVIFHDQSGESSNARWGHLDS